MDNKSPPPRVRRFLPEPIETSSRSSKRHVPEVPDICQVSLGQSKRVNGDDLRHQGQRGIACTFGPVHSPLNAQEHAPEPMEIARVKRRFLPQPTETSTRSSRNRPAISRAEDGSKLVKTPSLESVRTHGISSTESGPSTKPQALPQPIGTSPMASRSSLQRHPQTSTAPDLSRSERESSRDRGGSKPVRRFLPQPIESVKLSRRQGLCSSEKPDDGNSTKSTNPSKASPKRNTPRRFAPQLIETAKRSFRKGEAGAMLAASGEELPEYTNRLRHTRLSCIPYDPSAEGAEAISRPPESRFSYASLLRRQEGRRHSFRVPDLPAIPSNSSEGSEGSDVPSLSTSPSTPSDESSKRSKIKDQFRESCDERFSGYLLSLAARAAEKQLRDQALAAFPNEQVHQSVSHFAIDREEESDGEDQKVEVVLRDIKDNIVPFRRESITDLQWELDQMRRHKEEAELRGREQKNIDVGESRFSAAAIAARRAVNKADHTSNTTFLGGWQRDVGLAQMKHAASPPMLGSDLVFPFSLSPQTTQCENDQELASNQERDGREDGKFPGLWCASPRIEHEDGAGLWKGLCRKDDETSQSSSRRFRSGIVTPTPDIDGESYLSLNKAASHSPSTQPLMARPESESSRDHTDKVLSLEEEIDREFHDGFVTQVYNYLSLGYPSLARYYDYELSKISGIPVDDLRRDDLRTDAKGYIGAPEGVGVNEEGVTGGKCMRWTALRLYIREWARQQPRMAGNDSSLDTWGVRERKGSWAV